MATTMIRGGCRSGKTMRKSERPRLVSFEPAIQAHYERCLANGCTPKLAEALAFREGPALRTDAAFLEGHSNGNQFAGNPRQGDWYAKRARAAGVSTQGKIYLSGLAAFPGDPQAWVADRHDVESLLEKRGWSGSGMVNKQAREPEENPIRPAGGIPGGVAEDIIERETARCIDQNPEIAPTPKERKALKEKIRARRKPHWVK